jgi:Alginate lyase
MPLDPHATPSGNFDLSNWKIGLPVDSAGGFAGTSLEVKNLAGYEHPSYFFTATDGAMTFVAPAEGATTTGSQYARSELREMIGPERAAWSLATGGMMSATLEIDQVPIKFGGTIGRVIIGQIHGEEDELVRLYWEDGKLYFANDQAGPNNSEQKFYFLDAAGKQPHVALNERFSYTISAKGDDLVVTVTADG